MKSPQLFNAKSKLMIAGTVLVLLFAVFLIAMIPNQLSHFRATLYSGEQGGWYYTLAKRLEEAAHRKHGRLKAVETEGSLDNIDRLLASKKPAFALVQGSVELPKQGVSVIAELKEKEIVYIASRQKDTTLTALAFSGKSIAIGPPKSGTAQLARTLFSAPFMKGVTPKFVTMDFSPQVDALINGTVSYAVFVLAPDSPLLDRLFARHMSLIDLAHCEAIAKHFSFLTCGVVERGFFNSVADIPPRTVRVLQTNILLVANDHVKRSDVVSILSLIRSRTPDIVDINRRYSGVSGTPFSEDARRFFDTGGATLTDRYIPWLTNFIPFALLLQVAMGLGVLFKGMAGLHRFQLWRIDTVRAELEESVAKNWVFARFKESQEAGVQMEDLSEHQERIQECSSFIAACDDLLAKTAKASFRMFVPMGNEALYRYQEELIRKLRASLLSCKRELSASLLDNERQGNHNKSDAD